MKKLIFIPILFISIIINATNYYVATAANGGNDANVGSILSPWLTVAHACSQVPAGSHTINIGAGTFTETLRCNKALGVSIVGVVANPLTSIIVCHYVGASYLDAQVYTTGTGEPDDDNGTISYIAFDGDATSKNAIVCHYLNNIEIHHCTFDDFLEGGIYFRGNNQSYPDPPTIGYSSNNKVYNCTFSNISTRGLGSDAHVRIEGQDSCYIYSNTFTQTNRAVGSNGNILSGDWNSALKIHDNTFTKNDDENLSWHFFAELWHWKGGGEVYNNTFNGNAVFDVVDVTKELYDFGLKIYNNDFLVTTQFDFVYRTNFAIGIEERGSAEYVFIYNNYFKNFSNGVILYGIADDDETIYFTDAEFNEIWIYYNLFENIGYSDYEGCYPILISGSDNCATYDVTWNNIYILNNTITSNSKSSAGIEWHAAGVATNIDIRNNIIYDFVDRPIYLMRNVVAASIDNISVEHNDYYSNGTNAAVWDGNLTVTNKTESDNITTDPTFTTPITNCILLAGSPCINTGMNVNLTVDYAGNLVSFVPCIGAYEYGANPPALTGTVFMKHNGKFVKHNGKLMRN